MGHVYALLVGINRYLGPVRSLRGCCNDVYEVEEFLSATAAGRLTVKKLLDLDATRESIIRAFRDHLGQAKAGDTALFWFSGHGSTQPVPPAWWQLEPSGHMQTLVCADSRCNGVPDLRDKELAVLIGEVAGNGAHVAVVLDSCHASGATREPAAAAVRWAPDLSPADPSLFLPELQAVVQGLALPALKGGSDHVALAACRSHQAAAEIRRQGRHNGLFTASLLAELRRAGPISTYRDVLAGARRRVENRLSRQTPVLFPITDSIVDQPFLGGAIRIPPPTMTMRQVAGSWEIDAGLCHGIDAADGGSWVAVHGAGAVREARIVGSSATRSRVSPEGWHPAADQLYPVVLSRVPMPATTVAIGGRPDDDGAACARVIEALERAGPGGHRSPYVRAVSQDTDAEIAELAVAAPGGCLGYLILSADGSALTDDVPDHDGKGAAKVVNHLEHIARWRHIKALANPVSMLAGAVELEIVPALSGELIAPRDRPGLKPGADGLITIGYDAGPPGVFVRLRNLTERRLYCAVLDLTDQYRIHAALFPGDFLGPRQLGAAAAGHRIELMLPPGRAARPGASVRDWLMLIVAEDEFNSAVFTLPALTEPALARQRDPLAISTLIERLGMSALERDAVIHPSAANDWWTGIVPVLTRVQAREHEEADLG